MSGIEVGRTYAVTCPFTRDVFSEWGEDGVAHSLTWKPGVRWTEGEYPEAIAHGVGQVLYSVVSVHELPRPYPARVFYTRQWVSPDGKAFGKKALRVTTREAFRRRLAGYRPQGFDGWSIEEMGEEECAALLASA